GPDSFTYQANDGLADSGAATVNIAVTEVNDPPIAHGDQATLAEDTGVAIDVRANDSPGPPNEASQGVPLSSVTQPGHGQTAIITGGADAGKVRYIPVPDYSGGDFFFYLICDDGTTNGLPDPKCSTAKVAVTVTAVNDAPVALDDSYGMH